MRRGLATTALQNRHGSPTICPIRFHLRVPRAPSLSQTHFPANAVDLPYRSSDGSSTTARPFRIGPCRDRPIAVGHPSRWGRLNAFGTFGWRGEVLLQLTRCTQQPSRHARKAGCRSRSALAALETRTTARRGSICAEEETCGFCPAWGEVYSNNVVLFYCRVVRLRHR